MKIEIDDKSIQIIKIDDEYFSKEKEKLINDFFEISNSNNLEETFDLEEFFQNHYAYSVICAIKNGKIIGYMYGARRNEYLEYMDNDSTEWHIGYVKTHFNYQRQGIGTIVLLTGILDMIKQGAKKIYYTPNEQSYSLFENIVTQRNCLEIEKENFGRKVLIKKVKNYR